MKNITFELQNNQKVDIISEGKKIGHIFTPSGSSETHKNVVQICGFSEAFDFWGCGIFKGFKDIQLLFDNKKMEGESILTNNYNRDWLKDCSKCYMHPCQCEVKDKNKIPFIVKSHIDLKNRITEYIKNEKLIQNFNKIMESKGWKTYPITKNGNIIIEFHKDDTKLTEKEAFDIFNMGFNTCSSLD